MPGLNLWLAEKDKRCSRCTAGATSLHQRAPRVGLSLRFDVIDMCQRGLHAICYMTTLFGVRIHRLSYKCKCNHFESFDLYAPWPTVFKVIGCPRKQFNRHKTVKVVCIKCHIIKSSLDFLVYKCGALAGIDVYPFFLHVFIYLIWEACNAGDYSGSIINFM